MGGGRTRRHHHSHRPVYDTQAHHDSRRQTVRDRRRRRRGVGDDSAAIRGCKRVRGNHVHRRCQSARDDPGNRLRPFGDHRGIRDQRHGRLVARCKPLGLRRCQFRPHNHQPGVHGTDLQSIAHDGRRWDASPAMTHPRFCPATSPLGGLLTASGSRLGATIDTDTLTLHRCSS